MSATGAVRASATTGNLRRAPEPSGRPRPSRRRRALRAVALLLAPLALATLAAGWVEVFAARSDADRYPLPGRIVPVSAASLHLICTGTGSPTVLLEAGLGEPALSWADVQTRVDDDLRVCSYDRAGLGWSGPGAERWRAADAARQLAELLEVSGEPGPFVLVAHSVGALVAREFRQLRPEQVGAMVLLDPTDEVAVRVAGVPAVAVAERRVYDLLVRTGVLRRLGSWVMPRVVGSAPPEALLDDLPAVYGRREVATSLRELRGTVASAEHLAATEDRDWGDLPVVVVSAASATDAARGAHAALAGRSSRGRHTTAPRGGHYVHYDDAALVVRVVAAVAATVR